MLSVCANCGFYEEQPVTYFGWGYRKTKYARRGLLCPECKRAHDVALKAAQSAEFRKHMAIKKVYAKPALKKVTEFYNCFQATYVTALGISAWRCELAEQFIRQKIRQTSFEREIKSPLSP